MISPAMPLETEKKLSSELNSREKLLWTGQPLANLAGKGLLPIVLFGIPWTAVSIFIVVIMTWASSGMASSNPFPFNLMPLLLPLLGVPFVLIGLGMLSAPYWMRLKARKTVYAITDNRALILSPTWYGAISVRSIPPDHLNPRPCTLNPDGSGTLTFTRLTTERRRAGPDGGSYYVTVGFENIIDVRDVDVLLTRTFSASFKTTSTG